MGYTLILAIVVFSFRLYMISSKEVFDNDLFTDYFQVDEAGNGGLELTTSNFTTFEKEYNFVKEEVVEKKEEFAIQLLEENFNSGDTLASYILSDIYQNGCGTINQDEKKSEMYNFIARQNNIPGAEEQFRSILLHNINPTLKK